MRKLLSVAAVLLLFFTTKAQIVDPIKWKWCAEKINETEYKIIIEGTIEKGWHTYSQYQGDEGAVPTKFTFEKSPNIEYKGKTTETSPNTHEGMDDVFRVVQKYFSDKVFFTQTVKLNGKTNMIKGSFEYMVCNDKTCLPPNTVNFSIDVSKDLCEKKNDGKTLIKTDTVTKKNPNTGENGIITDSSTAITNTPPNTTINTSGLSTYYADFFNKQKFGEPVNLCGEEDKEMNLWLAIFLGFAGGFLALFTPCVFPMIPLTISYFTKRAEKQKKGNKDAVVYGFFIVLIFVLFALPFLLFNISSNALHELSTNVYVNLIFFVIFILFAFSLFGFYEIQLPSSLTNSADKAANKQGYAGIFFMALTLVLVSFSCTGPILGTLLASMAASANGKLNFVMGMASFGLGMGLPFILLAFFPSLLKKLPKSGSWMDAVKKVFAILELMLAIKFFSNADLAGHWGILKREIFLAFWIALGVFLILYLMGFVKIGDNTNIDRKHPVRLTLTALAVAFVGYCFWGLIGKDVPLFSGILPPNYYSIFPKVNSCPNDLSCVKSYKEGLALAKASGKPLLIDFTGFNCANCRRMEENIWTDPEVFHLLNDKYIIASLYVDDYQNALPDSLVYISPRTGEKRSSYGHKWSDFQTICFNSNTQPQYVLISPDERLLNKPWSGFEADAKKYQDFLECGLDAMKQVKQKQP